MPTSGINGAEEQETRATSALLAVLPVVRDFAAALLRPFGAPTSGQLETFIEVPLKTTDERTIRPDGLIRATRGQNEWCALVEVKTSTNDLGRDQIESYLDLARDNGFSAVVTISNQLAPSGDVHPVEVDKRKLKKVALHHLSWAEVVSAAVVQRVHHGVTDPEQAWILAELIRYLQHPRSGAVDFVDMGGSWVQVREAVIAGTLRATDKGVTEVVSRWDQLLRFAALRLERQLGSGVQVGLTRKEQSDSTLRPAALVAELVQRGRLTGSLRIPNTVGDLLVCADLRTGQCTTEVDVAAPVDGRALTRLNWLLRQLNDAPPNLRVDAYAHMARTSTSELLGAAREKPASLVPDPKIDLRRFRLSATSNLGTKRGIGRGAFIDSVLGAVDGFYESVLQGLRPWVAKAPQLPKGGSALAEAGIDTTVLPDEQEHLDSNGAAAEADSTEAATRHSDGSAELVSWDSAEEGIGQERTEGFPANEHAAETDAAPAD
ncbi:MAG: stress response protein [Acidimicrobiales bacterium]